VAVIAALCTPPSLCHRRFLSLGLLLYVQTAPCFSHFGAKLVFIQHPRAKPRLLPRRRSVCTAADESVPSGDAVSNHTNLRHLQGTLEGLKPTHEDVELLAAGPRHGAELSHGGFTAGPSNSQPRKSPVRPVPADMERIKKASEAAPMTVVVGAARGGPNERVVVASVSLSTRGQLTRLSLVTE